ncbi:transcription factor GTE10-like [Gastrolobium bilobum]|uniref:transcription factor GTE10-like n=1 Tax=Gastrolobium bilobum TaxID=150636 RepID=UPI002AB104A4|nr:transcription factor GTE10-like [Gastrolobium bilobum]
MFLVDIVGGNDPPISNYPPVEIEKDGINRTSKCSSSSCSSSESGTSSSDDKIASGDGTDESQLSSKFSASRHGPSTITHRTANPISAHGYACKRVCFCQE